MKRIFLLAISVLMAIVSDAQNIRQVEAEEDGRFYSGPIDDEWGKVDSLVVTGVIGGEYNFYLSQITDLAQFFNLTGLNMENCQIENDKIRDWTFFPTGINSGAKANMPDIPEKGYTHIKTEERYFRVNLKHITFPKNIKSIGERAFYRCNLKELDIPSSVSVIGFAAFAECDYLRSVKIHVQSPDMIDINEGYAFSGIPENVVLYVPQGTKAAFEADGNWNKTFKTIKEFDDVSGITQNVVSESNDKSDRIYSLDGRYAGKDFSVLSKGVYVVNGKKVLK